MNPMTRAGLARILELLLVQPEATHADVERVCALVRTHGFHGICVNGSRVELAYSLLQESEAKVTALVGFPLGAMDSDAKRYETEVAVDHGAHEIEVVLNAGRLKEGDHAGVLRELRDISEAADERPVKLALEVGLLNLDERAAACELALESGVKFVGTGSGVRLPASVADVSELRSKVGPKFGVKAAGGIQDAKTALALIEAGATRLAALNGVAILDGLT